MFYELVTKATRSQKQACFAFLDMLTTLVALPLSILLVARVPWSDATLSQITPLWLSLTGVGVALSWWLGLPKITLNAYETRGIVRTAAFATSVGLCGMVLAMTWGMELPAAIFFIFALLVLVGCATWRIVLRQVTIQIYRQGKNRMRVLIYGAGQTGQQLVAALRQDDAIHPVAFVDDNPTLQSLVISGLRVFAPSRIKDLVQDKDIQRVVLAMPSISHPAQARIAHKLRDIGCDVHALPSFAELVGDGDLRKHATPVSLDSLLGRGGLHEELPAVSHAYSGRRILVTGAGGSIGSELCRQLIACKPESVVLLDHSELALYSIDKELRALSTSLRIVPVLGSVMNETLLRDVLRTHNIEVVLHAAAYKHLPLVERNAIAGLRNNVIGTKIIADAARDAGVDRFILVSSDKAVRPTNVMGASKRLAEMIVQDLATRSAGTRFSMVRFGNVLGSSGSVVPLFEEQIARGGPVTLTHGEVTRYFMTMPEAARLVLLAGSFAHGGEVFVLDMGAPVPIKRLARQMIEGAGYSVKDTRNPDGDIEIKVTGLRTGEKLHEELLIEPDMLTTPHNKILRAQEGCLSEFEMATAMKDLRQAIEINDEDGARAVIDRWVEQGSLIEAAQSK